jgi:nitrogen fixation protein NifB
MSLKPLRVAVASSDGTRVDQHLGRAERLFIFEASGAGATLLEQRSPDPGAGGAGHDERRLAEILRLTEDCSVVLALQVGPAFRQQLECRGIRVLTAGGMTAPLLDRIGSSYLARHREQP